MYYKRWKAFLLDPEDAGPRWVRWVHQSRGESHCADCLKLDGCLFLESKAPMCPHHPNCHCTLEPVDYAAVLLSARAYSDYSKFDPFLFDTKGEKHHGKDKLFNLWGYFVEDSPWLQAELERQALEKYLAGDYTLGKLNKDGQRISIQIELPRRIGSGTVSFITGWMVEANGRIRLATPYGGK